MSSVYDKLRRILSLERDQGYRNRAVIGGLARFLAYWAKEAQEEAQHTTPPVSVEQVMAQLEGYAELAPEARSRAVEQILALLGPEVEASSGQQPGAPPVALPQPAAPQGNHAPAGETPAEAPKAAPPRPKTKAEEQFTLNSPLSSLMGVNKVNQERLARLGLKTIRDLLYHFPRRYDDFSALKTINRLALGDEVTVVGVVQEAKLQHTRSGQALVRVVVYDGTGTIEARWFNQPYLLKRIKEGVEIVLSGRVEEYLGRLVFTSPEWEPLQRELLHTARLVPIYPLTEGLNARWLRRLMKSTLDYWCPRLADPLPGEMLSSLGLMDLGRALAQIHFPENRETLEQARQRLCFDELLLLQLGIQLQRQAWRAEPGPAVPLDHAALEAFIAGLPFQLTNAQRRAIGEILQDMERPVPMSRLLQGDVGSGKTVVAAAAILAAARAGLQAAIMAPTSILAEQHYRTLTQLLAGFPEIRCALLVGSLSAAEKERLHQEIAQGAVQVVVGTHALIQSTVEFARLGLVVVDEQHRFGVEQRGALRAKGDGLRPHLLAMSATPIPRTLAMTFYGDLDLTVLDELPPNRQRVLTAVRDRSSRERIYAFIASQVEQGRQAFIICPLVEESEQLDAKSAVEEYERLQRDIFPRLRLGLLHGRMNADEKDQVMTAFKEGAYDILVSTAVVEVGIDVPNATVILVEGAERFGLAQLHQFRGRVGRGEWKSYCILLSDDPSEESLKRLQVMTETDDGFVLAEKDLELRGPGDFFGVRQSGLPTLKVARLSDLATLEKAREQAQRLLARDPSLSLPEHQALAASVRRFWSAVELS
jgi:ATP-dependent DNA helicase RecG